mmetsp:Transcript_40305/g.96662  ORF Transcript_40305/g.96662 Transcript_40305/m.96662 type:complete len:120 (-) Transcript_40305:104-463(-)
MSESEDEVVDPMAAALANLPPMRVRQVDLPEKMFTKMQLIVVEALQSKKLEKDAAQEIKRKIDTEPDFNQLPGKGPWQCVVGKSFSGSITFEAYHLAFFDVIPMQKTVLIFKSLGVQAI